MRDKLGWVIEYCDDLKRWEVCQSIVSRTLDFTNLRGVYRGATDELRTHLQQLQLPSNELSQRVQDQLIDAYWQCEQRLVDSPHASLRMPASTEVLESVLGRFKQLQRQHNRGSFTSLMAALAALLKPSTPQAIAKHLTAVSNRDVKEWIRKAKLNNSTQAKKNKAYREAMKCQTDTITI